MRISDWSSDVCSSDLPDAAVHGGIFGCVGAPPVFRAVRYFVGPFGGDGLRSRARRHRRPQWGAARAHDRRLFDPRSAVENEGRQRVVLGRSELVRGVTGEWRIIYKNNHASKLLTV